MNKEKDQTKPVVKKREVKTPTPPQDMNPSKPPHRGKKVLGDEEKSDEEKRALKKSIRGFLSFPKYQARQVMIKNLLLASVKVQKAYFIAL
jgi:hypothetical protein